MGCVTVIVPVNPPLHNTLVWVAVVTSAGPGSTFTLTELLVHPSASVTRIVWGPAGTLVKVVVFPVWVTLLSSTKVKGPVPLVGFTVIVPLLPPRQAVAVEVALTFKPAPVPTLVDNAGTVVQPLASVTLTV